MTLHFRGGEIFQRGRGVGGFFRTLAALAKPVLASVGKSALRTVKSKATRKIASSVGKQAAKSLVNVSREFVRGGNVKGIAAEERKKFKNLGVEIIDNLQLKAEKRKQLNSKSRVPKKRRVTDLKSMQRYA